MRSNYIFFHIQQEQIDISLLMFSLIRLNDKGEICLNLNNIFYFFLYCFYVEKTTFLQKCYTIKRKKRSDDSN